MAQILQQPAHQSLPTATQRSVVSLDAETTEAEPVLTLATQPEVTLIENIPMTANVMCVAFSDPYTLVLCLNTVHYSSV